MRGQPTGEDWVVGWDDVLAAGRAAAAADPAGFDRLWQQIQPEDRLSLIYTSGTTGTPKGVTYTHRNILWTAESIGRLAGRDLLADARLISYLPLAHAAERVDQPLVAAVAMRRPRRDRHGPVLPRPHPAAALPDRDPADHLRRRPAGVGEAAGRDPRRRSRRAGRAAPGDGAARTRRRPPGCRPAPSRQAGAGRTRRGARPVRADLRGHPGEAGLRPVPVGHHLGRADAAGRASCSSPGSACRCWRCWGMSELTGPATAVSPHDVRFGTCGAALPGVEARLADGRRADRPRWERDGRLLPRARADRADHRTGRLAAHRRHRPGRRGRLLPHRRPQERTDHHLQRQEHRPRRRSRPSSNAIRWSGRRSRSATGAAT